VNCGSLFFRSGNGPLCTGKVLARGRTNRFRNIFLLWPWPWLSNLIYLQSRCIACQLSASKVITFESYRLETHTHTADLLLYLDHKMVRKTSTYFTRPIL